MDGETKAGCLNLLFEIPYVSWIFLLGPPFLVIFGVEGLLKISLTDSNWFILILSIFLLIWLRFLEIRVGIRMTLPFIPIPWLWITWAGIAIGILALFGLF